MLQWCLTFSLGNGASAMAGGPEVDHPVQQTVFQDGTDAICGRLCLAAAT
jgi:hypothetical protein